MIKKIGIYFWLFLPLIYIHCGKEKTVNKTIIPFHIVTGLPNDLNYIKNVFSLPDNTFVIYYFDSQNNISKLFHYNDNLQLTDSLTLAGVSNLSSPVIENKNTFIMIGDAPSGQYAYRLDFRLNLVDERDITNLLIFFGGANKYPSILGRLSNGNIVMGYNNVLNDQNMICIVCVKDLFLSNTREWNWQGNNWGSDWIVNFASDANGSFYFTGIINGSPGGDNFIQKFNNDGFAGYRKTFPFTLTNSILNVENDRLIYQDFENFYYFDTAGNDIGNTHIDGDYYLPPSGFFRMGNNYYYSKDVKTPNGNFVSVRKTDASFNTISEIVVGNQGTNLIRNPYYLNRFLIPLSGTSFVAVYLIENPMLSGNQWMLRKFDQNLVSY